MEWETDLGVFTAKIPGGVAIITEVRQQGYDVPIGGELRYTVELRRDDGECLNYKDDLASFEAAEEICQIFVSDLRYADDGVNHWIDALTLVSQHLPPTIPPIHQRRIASLQNWLRDRERSATPIPHIQPLDWEQTDDYWSAVTPHGLAIIQHPKPQPNPFQFGQNQSIYRVKLWYADGVEINPRDTFYAWEDAVEGVERLLEALEMADVEEHALDVLGFSLSLYQHLLQGAVPSQIIDDLEALKGYLWQTLP